LTKSFKSIDIKAEHKKADAEVKRVHADEIKRMKAAFKRELKLLIESEIKDQKRETKQQEKLT
jgi:hypothetical protein